MYKIPSQQIENRIIGCRIETTRSDGHLDSVEMLSEESQVIASDGFTYEHPTSPDN